MNNVRNVLFLIVILYVTVQKSTQEHPRFKLRGPQGAPRAPPPQYMKKWQQQQQMQQHLSRGHHGQPLRSRPIPVHMPPQHKIPLGAPHGPRPIAPPVRNFWKNGQTTYRTPQEKPKLVYVKQQQQQQQLHQQPQQEKHPFLSSPKINNNHQEYDFHIQTNSIPTHVNPIKQVGEKGPIHTIPAPNLSLADKPIVVEEVHRPVQQTSYLSLQQSHQYQVTEPPNDREINPKQKLYRGQSQQQQQQQAQQQQQIYFAPDPEVAQQTHHQEPQQHHIQHQRPLVQQQDLFYNQEQLNSQLNPKELFQLLNTFPQQQQEILEAYRTPFEQEQQPQQKQQGFIQLNQQLFQGEPQFVQQSASDKISEPEYHSFNYEEQNLRQKDALPQIYVEELDPAGEASELKTVSRNALENPLAQSQYVQNYFGSGADSRDDRGAGPDAKPSREEEQQEEDETVAEKVEAQKNADVPTEYFTSLPSKKAADALASLQAAGKINHKLMHTAKEPLNVHDKTPMTIYVPDEFDGNSNNNNKRDGASKLDDFDEYDEEGDEQIKQQEEEETGAFGHRINPKK